MAYNPLETYLQEADELLSQIEESALSLSAGDRVNETINHLFRAFHTIKGSGAMCGLDAVAAFTHHVETMLDQVRGGAIGASARLVELVLEAKDQIKLLLGAEQGGAAVPHGSSERLVAAIEEFASTGTSGHENCLDSASQRAPESGEIGERDWLVRFRPNPGLLASGGNPAALLKDLRTLGSCDITAHTDLLPPWMLFSRINATSGGPSRFILPPTRMQSGTCSFLWRMTATSRSSDSMLDHGSINRFSRLRKR